MIGGFRSLFRPVVGHIRARAHNCRPLSVYSLRGTHVRIHPTGQAPCQDRGEFLWVLVYAIGRIAPGAAERPPGQVMLISIVSVRPWKGESNALG